MDYSKVPILPAATVVCTRHHHANGLEVLLLRRNKKLKFASGFWVFPGGKVEKTDSLDGSLNTESAKTAAIREANEEAGISLDQNKLVHFMNWTTPSPSIKRFNTYFFMSELDIAESSITIDDSEIKEYVWVTPKDAIESLSTSDLLLLPPTFLTLVRMMHCAHYDDVISEFTRTTPLDVAPRTGLINGEFQSMYEGDAGYESHNVLAPGPRHRISGRLDKSHYRFEFKDCDHIFPVNGGYSW